jgi:cytidylate kinase
MASPLTRRQVRLYLAITLGSYFGNSTSAPAAQEQSPYEVSGRPFGPLVQILKEAAVPVVTISRQYASGGGPIAQRVANELGAELLDRGLIREVAQRLGLPEVIVSEHDERGDSFVAQLVNALRIGYPDITAPGEIMDLPSAYLDLSDRAFVQTSEQVIQEAAKSDNIVIVGRGSHYVLRNHRRGLHVYVYAPFESRVQRVMTEQSVGRDEAERRTRDFDRARARFARHFYHADWQSPQNYHLMLNPDDLGDDVAVDLIVQAARRR